ncbi:MAG: hypothetical protein M0R68_07440 [Bacteroidetes bacterium]|nr:hypothetical protein [Bacteroidota bacterium]
MGESMEVRSVSFLDVVALMLKWKKLILWNLIIITGTTIIISFFLPRYYKSTSSILPSEKNDLLSGLGGAAALLKNFSSSPISRIAGKQTIDFMGILNSRSAMDSVVEKYNLISVYEVPEKSREKAIKILRANVEFTLKEDNTVVIDVFDEDAVRAASMANYFAEILSSISNRMMGQQARLNKEFILGRLMETRQKLKECEESLRAYQEKHASMIIPAEAEESMKGIAELYAQSAKNEIAISVLKRNYGSGNEQLKLLNVEQEELNKRLMNVPQVGLEYLRLYREMLIQQKIFEFLVPMLEQARIEENKDLPIVMVLDSAIVSERPDKPSKRVYASVAVVVSIFLSILLISVLEYYSYVRDQYPEKYKEIITLLTGKQRDVM